MWRSWKKKSLELLLRQSLLIDKLAKSSLHRICHNNKILLFYPPYFGHWMVRCLLHAHTQSNFQRAFKRKIQETLKHLNQLKMHLWNFWLNIGIKSNLRTYIFRSFNRNCQSFSILNVLKFENKNFYEAILSDSS